MSSREAAFVAATQQDWQRPGGEAAGEFVFGRSFASYLGEPLPPFRYRILGNTSIIGRHAVVFEHERLKITGWFAWAAWAVIHVYQLVGFQHWLLVSIQWLWRYLTNERARG